LTVKKIDWEVDTYFLETWLPNIAHTVRGSHALWPRFTRIHLSPERNASDLWTCMKRAVFLQTYQSGFYSCEGAQDLRLFETGIATVTTQVLSSSRRIVAQLAEPILVYSLNEYINKEAPDEMAVYLKQRLADAPGPEARGKVWEQSVPNALHSLFKTSSTADNIQWSNSSYQHQSHNFYFVQQPTKHLTFGIDSRFTDLSFADWLENPSMSAYFSPENDSGPDVATVTEDGVLVLVLCKFTQPPNADKKTSKPTAFSAISSLCPNTMYRPRKDAKKIAGRDVAIGKKDLYVRTRLAIFNNFKYVVAVILAYGGLAWPQGCKIVEQKRKFITEFTVPVDGAVAGSWNPWNRRYFS